MTRVLFRLLLACFFAAGMSVVAGCGEDGGSGDPGTDDDAGAGADVGTPDADGLDSGDPDASAPDTGHRDTDPDDSGDTDPRDDAGDADEDTDGANPTSADAFCDDMLDAMLTKFEECVGGPKDIWGMFLRDTQDVCGTLTAGVDAGRITYQSANAQGCLDALDSLTCDALMNSDDMPQACQTTLAGTVAQSGTCYDNIECTGDSYCSESAQQCPGQCEPKVAEGGSCTGDSECQNPLECGSSGTCEQPDGTDSLPGRGEPCPGGQCQLGLFCNSDNATCEEPDREGEACVHGQGSCETFTYCGPNQTCVRYNGVGVACGLNDDGEWAGCLPEAYCDFDGGTSGTCAAAKNAGESCQSGSECKSRECSDANICVEMCAPPTN